MVSFRVCHFCDLACWAAPVCGNPCQVQREPQIFLGKATSLTLPAPVRQLLWQGVRMTCSRSVALCSTAHRPQLPLAFTLTSYGACIHGRTVLRCFSWPQYGCLASAVVPRRLSLCRRAGVIDKPAPLQRYFRAVSRADRRSSLLQPPR